MTFIAAYMDGGVVKLECDCPYCYTECKGMVSSFRDVSEFRAEAQGRYGWVWIDGKDYCSQACSELQCVHERTEPPKPTIPRFR